MNEPDTPVLAGVVQGQKVYRWIAFEIDPKTGCLNVRTLWGHKDLSDPARSQEILKTLIAIFNEID